MSLSDNAHDER